MFKVVLDQSGHMLELPFLGKIEDCSSSVLAFETFEIEIVYNVEDTFQRPAMFNERIRKGDWASWRRSLWKGKEVSESRAISSAPNITPKDSSQNLTKQLAFGRSEP